MNDKCVFDFEKYGDWMHFVWKKWKMIHSLVRILSCGADCVKGFENGLEQYLLAIEKTVNLSGIVWIKKMNLLGKAKDAPLPLLSNWTNLIYRENKGDYLSDAIVKHINRTWQCFNLGKALVVF